jgi:hypothetical protein
MICSGVCLRRAIVMILPPPGILGRGLLGQELPADPSPCPTGRADEGHANRIIMGIRRVK